MGDEIDRANVIRVERIGTAWFAFVGPDGLGMHAMGATPETAVYRLLCETQRLGWCWDEWWTENRSQRPGAAQTAPGGALAHVGRDQRKQRDLRPEAATGGPDDRA